MAKTYTVRDHKAVVERTEIAFDGLVNVTKTHGARQIGSNASIHEVEYVLPRPDHYGHYDHELGTFYLAHCYLTVGGDAWGPGLVRKEFPFTEAGLADARKFLAKTVEQQRKRQSKKLGVPA